MIRKKKKRRGITPWKKTALKVCVLLLLAAAAIHGFRLLKALEFEDQREASRWGAEQTCAQVSAFMPMSKAMKEEDIQGLEYKIHTALAFLCEDNSVDRLEYDSVIMDVFDLTESVSCRMHFDLFR